VENVLLTRAEVTYESLRVLVNSLPVANSIRRDFDDHFGVDGAKIGDTLNIRKPSRYIVTEGQGLSEQDTTESSIPLVLDKQFHVDVGFTSKERALSLDNYSQRVIRPAMAALANKIEFSLLQYLYKKVANLIGTKNLTPNTLLTYTQALARLSDEAAPDDDLRSVVMSPLGQATMIDALKLLLNPGGDISKQFKTGRLGHFLNADFLMSQNCPAHTFGTAAGSPVVLAAGQTGSTLNITGATDGTVFEEGDVFSIGTAAADKVYAVNPQNRQSTGGLRQFVITARTVVGTVTTTVAALPIYPPITPSGQFQTVTASPNANATINLAGDASVTNTMGMAYHKDVAVLGSADLPSYEGLHECYVAKDKDIGVSIRIITAYDIRSDRAPTRMDWLGGYVALYPELATRIFQS